MRFTYDLGDGYTLGLRDLSTVDAFHTLTQRNLHRLRSWEPWAQGEQTAAGTLAYTQRQLEQYVAGHVVPCAIYRSEGLIGSASLRIDQYAGTGELGYWVDSEHEGRGAARRACEALIEHGLEAGLGRIEIRTAVENARSCALAERLGFVREGVLRSALPIGDTRLDVAVYARLAL